MFTICCCIVYYKPCSNIPVSAAMYYVTATASHELNFTLILIQVVASHSVKHSMHNISISASMN